MEIPVHRIWCLSTVQLELAPVHYWFMKKITVWCHQIWLLGEIFFVHINQLCTPFVTLGGRIQVNNVITLQAGPFSISSQSTSWHLSVKSEHYEQSSQQIIEACHLICQLGALAEVRPLEFDNVKYARGHIQYFFTPYQLNQGREFMHTSCKALTSDKLDGLMSLTLCLILWLYLSDSPCFLLGGSQAFVAPPSLQLLVVGHWWNFIKIQFPT